MESSVVNPALEAVTPKPRKEAITEPNSPRKVPVSSEQMRVLEGVQQKKSSGYQCFYSLKETDLLALTLYKLLCSHGFHDDP